MLVVTLIVISFFLWMIHRSGVVQGVSKAFEQNPTQSNNDIQHSWLFQQELQQQMQQQIIQQQQTYEFGQQQQRNMDEHIHRQNEASSIQDNNWNTQNSWTDNSFGSSNHDSNNNW